MFTSRQNKSRQQTGGEARPLCSKSRLMPSLSSTGTQFGLCPAEDESRSVKNISPSSQALWFLIKDTRHNSKGARGVFFVHYKRSSLKE